jgi:hypothetical protein
MKNTVSTRWIHERGQRELTDDTLLNICFKHFEKVEDHRAANAVIPLSDALKGGLAVFKMKTESLLKFDTEIRRDEQGAENLKRLFKMKSIPSDTAMRTILDEVDPKLFRPLMKELHQHGAKHGALKSFRRNDGKHIVTLDGTKTFSSKKVKCKQCLTKNKNNPNKTTIYHHQAVIGSLVTPGSKNCLPLVYEAIANTDGDNKNDCEANATKRAYAQMKEDYPHKKFIVVQDGLSSNNPQVRAALDHGFDYVFVAKEGDHKNLFAEFNRRLASGEAQTCEEFDGDKRNVYKFTKAIPLNAQPDAELVNLLEFNQYDSKSGKLLYHNVWVTSLEVSKETASDIAEIGRVRWKIENETFNTLKNSAYNLEHNFGHGEQFLHQNFTCLTLLTFFIDQLQELTNDLFNAAKDLVGTRKSFWSKIRSLTDWVSISTFTEIYTRLLIKAKVIMLETS